MKMFETKIGEQTVAWVVGENGVKSITAPKTDTKIVVALENEKFGTVKIFYDPKLLPFYATA